MPSERLRKQYQQRAWKRGGKLREAVFAAYGPRCVGCGVISRDHGGTAVLTLAHVNPHGPAEVWNLRPACRRCHGRWDGGRAGRPRR